MRVHGLRLSVALVLLVALTVAPIAAAAQQSAAGSAPGLFIDAAPGGTMAAASDAAARRVRYVQIDLGALSHPATALDLFPGAAPGVLTAVWDRVEPASPDTHVWVGHLQGVNLSSVTLAVNDVEGIVQGSITMPGGLYRVRYLGPGIHVVEEIDTSAFPEDLVIPANPPPDAPGDSLGEDDGSTIDVLVTYTPAARAAAGGAAAMNALVDLAVEETNTSYANSGITQRVRLVYKGEISYTESGDFGTDLYRLQRTSDGFMDGVHALRDQYRADLVALIIEGSQFCGIAFLMETVSSGFAPSAFSVTARTCATGYYSFGHELGHNMGARHDWFVDPTAPSGGYNHGYVATTKTFRTIMAYGDDCGGCTRIQRWSNPDLMYSGEGTGVAEGLFHAADNRKTLNNTAYTVANFRQATSVPIVTIVASDPSATEAGPTPGTFTVTRTAASPPVALTVLYAVAGTATAGSDYLALSGSVTIPAGSNSALITVTPINDALIEPTQTVVVTLRAAPAYVMGTPSSATVTITDDDTIRPPSNLTATAQSPVRIELGWRDNNNGETSFIIQRKTGAGGAWASIATVGANVTSFTNKGLRPNTEYFYRIKTCVRTVDCSGFSDEAQAKTPDLVPPSNLTATPQSAVQIVLGWQDSNVDKTSFTIQRKTGEGGRWANIATVGATVRSYTNARLSPNTKYFYRVKTCIAGTGCSGFSDYASATTNP